MLASKIPRSPGGEVLAAATADAAAAAATSAGSVADGSTAVAAAVASEVVDANDGVVDAGEESSADELEAEMMLDFEENDLL